jgi:hypothetical protein
VNGGTRSQTAPLVVELWYAEAPDIGDPRLLQALRSQWPTTELQLESIVVPHGDPPSPLLTVIMMASPPGEGGKALPDVGQTWDWVGAEVAVSASRRSLLVTEMFGDGRTPQERWRAMSGVVAELARLTRPTVLSWPQSQRVGDPELFAAGDLDGLINMRYFSIANDPGSWSWTHSACTYSDCPTYSATSGTDNPVRSPRCSSPPRFICSNLVM